MRAFQDRPYPNEEGTASQSPLHEGVVEMTVIPGHHHVVEGWLGIVDQSHHQLREEGTTAIQALPHRKEAADAVR
jgi:hypothetical protein